MDKVKNVTVYSQIPFKKAIKNMDICVDWKYEDKEDLLRIINRKGPHIPEIAPKYLNTITFLDRHESVVSV